VGRPAAGQIKRARASADIPLVPRSPLTPFVAWLGVACTAVTIAGCASTSADPSPGVAAAVVARAARSVVTVRCINTNLSASEILSATGTGFITSEGVVTASHVVSTCASSGPGTVSAGAYVASVNRDDPSHDVALIGLSSVASPLPLGTTLPSTSDPVELLGCAGSSTGGVTPLGGTVTATGATVTLHAEDGGQETLTNMIVVSANGVIPGDSGGPAIDAAGRVVGVVEGAGGGNAYITPASQVSALTS